MDYHVEELADTSGVAVDTIRYYQREKLLAPPRREGRRAFYDDAHLERIQEIRSLAQQGFSLAQIRELSAGDGSGLLVDLAQQNAVDPDLDKTELARSAERHEALVRLDGIVFCVLSSGLVPGMLDLKGFGKVRIVMNCFFLGGGGEVQKGKN